MNRRNAGEILAFLVIMLCAGIGVGKLTAGWHLLLVLITAVGVGTCGVIVLKALAIREVLSHQFKMSCDHAISSLWVDTTRILQNELHESAVEHGFWPPEGRNDGEIIALIHSELSEALEALRDGNPPSEKAKGYSQLEEELADAIIRILDFSAAHNLDVAGALPVKAAFNKTRPHKHGRQF